MINADKAREITSKFTESETRLAVDVYLNDMITAAAESGENSVVYYCGSGLERACVINVAKENGYNVEGGNDCKEVIINW